MPNAGVVMVLQNQTAAVVPAAPLRVIGRKTQQTLVGGQNQAFDKVQTRVQVNLQGGPHVLMGLELRLCLGLPMRGQISRKRQGNRDFNGHGYP